MAADVFEQFVGDCYRPFADVLLACDKGPMREVLEVFDRVTETGGTVWAAGNGGSAAIADHVLLVASSFGNSPNVVRACEYANAKGVPTIAFVGFKGGRLKEIATHVVHVAVDNYGIVEDTHQSLIHCLTQCMQARASGALPGG